jgi:hypothetical protein
MADAYYFSFSDLLISSLTFASFSFEQNFSK